MSSNPSPDSVPAPGDAPRDSASVVLLRDDAQGLQVLLMQRHQRSKVLGGTYVFPGGKLEYSDSAATALSLLDRTPDTLRHALGEPELDQSKAAGLFVAAIRETAEEVGVFLCQTHENGPGTADSFASRIQQPGTVLSASALAPWSRWITPRDQIMIERRFDTRFFLAELPATQAARSDGFEAAALRWMTPQQALQAYYRGEINLIPPQIVGLIHLSLYDTACAAIQAARRQMPPLIEPKPLREDGLLTMCYPGDPMHPSGSRAFPSPVPTRLCLRNGRFEPPGGTASLPA